MLQRCPSQQITFSRGKGTFWFDTDPSKSHIIIIMLIYFLVKIKWKYYIPTKIVTHITLTISVKIIAISQ